MPVLLEQEIQQALTQLPDWRLDSGELLRDFSFGDFGEAMSFVNSVAALAERAGHHPDIDVRYNKVKLALSSHDAGGITELDVKLAGEIGDLL
jgi:4a-hydroxytetrahydrobiopterin dehydratase